MGEWRQTNLGQLLSFSNGRSSPARGDGLPYPVYGSNGIIGYAEKSNAGPGSIIIGRVGSYCGSLYMSGQECWVTDNALRATALNDDDPRYLYYLLSTLGLNNWRSGSGQPLLNQEILSHIPAAVPPVSEQRAIAHILGTLDDKIELNRRMNETLEAMARALFKSWFVDFDPVRAKMEGRDTGLPGHTADLFPDRLVDSELGEIPEGWEILSLDEIASFLNGLALQKYPPSEWRWLPVIKIAQLRAGNTVGADRACADLDPEYIVQDGDILFSWSGSLECVFWAGGPGALNQHLFKVTSTTYPRWLCYLGVHHHLDDFRHIAAGKATTMGHIQRHHLSDAMLAVPSPGLLAAMDAIMGPLVESIWHRQVESRTLVALRDTLLPKLISGELRVDPNRILSESAGEETMQFIQREARAST